MPPQTVCVCVVYMELVTWSKWSTTIHWMIFQQNKKSHSAISIEEISTKWSVRSNHSGDFLLFCSILLDPRGKCQICGMLQPECFNWNASTEMPQPNNDILMDNHIFERIFRVKLVNLVKKGENLDLWNRFVIRSSRASTRYLKRRGCSLFYSCFHVLGINYDRFVSFDVFLCSSFTFILICHGIIGLWFVVTCSCVTL